MINQIGSAQTMALEKAESRRAAAVAHTQRLGLRGPASGALPTRNQLFLFFGFFVCETSGRRPFHWSKDPFISDLFLAR